MENRTVTVMAAATLVGGTLLASAGNDTSAPQRHSHKRGPYIYAGHRNGASTNAEHNIYAGHKAGAGAPYGYKDAPGDHALGGGPG